MEIPRPAWHVYNAAQATLKIGAEGKTIRLTKGLSAPEDYTTPTDISDKSRTSEMLIETL